MLSESQIIELFQKDSYLLDDCAAIPTNGEINLVSTDSLSEGTHFRRDWSSPEDLAIKLLHVNISDLHSSGAKPSWCFLNLGLPSIEDDFIRRFARAFREERMACGIDLLGGDTFRSSELQLQLTMGGYAKRHVMRSGGRPGDVLYVTGTFGLSLAGYLHLSGQVDAGGMASLAVGRHLRPRSHPYVDLTHVHAAMDVSDGIAQDSARLAKASRVRLEIDLEKIPVAAGLKITAEEAVVSGEELELLFLAHANFSDFLAVPIGVARPGEGCIFMRQGDPVEIGTGFSHFHAVDSSD